MSLDPSALSTNYLLLSFLCNAAIPTPAPPLNMVPKPLVEVVSRSEERSRNERDVSRSAKLAGEGVDSDKGDKCRGDSPHHRF